MRRVFTLSTREQLLVYGELGAYLDGSAAQPPSEVEKEIAAREASLEAMRKVATHLGLPDGAHIKVRDYDEAARELGLTVSSKQVRTAWGRWREATRVFAGGQIRESPAQRAQRRDSSGKQSKHEAPLTALHEWLTDEHGIGGGEPVSFTTHDYDKYCEARNPKLKDSPRLPPSATVVHKVGLPWDDCVECARGNADYVQLREARARQAHADEGPLGLIGGGDVARILGLRQLDPKTRTSPGFPVPVAQVSSRNAWVSDDIRTYKETGQAPSRKPGSYQNKLYDIAQAAAALGHNVDYLRTLINQNSDLIPQPEGRVGKTYYWRRATIDNWKRPADRRKSTQKSTNTAP